MSVSSTIIFTSIAAAVSVGYVVLGMYLLRGEDGVGVHTFSIFSILWGVKFISSSVAFYVLSINGVTSSTGLQPGSLPDTTVILLLSVIEPPLSALLTVVSIFAWLWFVLLYTRRIGRNEKIAVAVLGGITFIILAANGIIGSAVRVGAITINPVLQTGFTEFATVIEILGTGVAVGVGMSLLYSTANNHPPFSKRAVLGLTVPILLPWLVGYLYRFALITEFQLISVIRTITLTAGLFGLLLTVNKYGLFEQLPASRSVGRQTAFNTSNTAIVVVNNDKNVSDVNSAACELFSVRTTECIGDSFEELLPESVTPEEVRAPEPTVFKINDVIVEAMTTTVTDESGETIGETVVLTDITDERRRQQRIQVLNRVLRHNLRNDLNAVKGYIGVMTDDGSDTEEFQSMAEELVNDLVTIGDKAQSTEQVLQADPITNNEIPITEIVSDAINSVELTESREDVVNINTDIPESIKTRVNPRVIQSIIEEVIENAIRHTDEVTITITYHNNSNTLAITDDGPGIPDHEIDVLQNAEETDLQHGSGLGLWLIKWGTETFGGTIEFNTDNGTEVKIEFPQPVIEYQGENPQF